MRSPDRMFNLQCRNSYFLSQILPGMDVITNTPETPYEKNSIIHKNILLYATQGSGKTETIRSLVEEIVNKYGKDNVNAVISSGSNSLEDLMVFGLDNKLIQVQVADDFTLQEVPKEVIKAYFKIRHIWYKRIKRPFGYILSIFSLHRFHSGAKEIRSTADAVLIRDDSLNPYDHSVIKGFIGEYGLEDLHFIEENRDLHPVLKSYSIFATRTKRVGLVYFPLASKNHLREISPIKSKYTNIEQRKLIRNCLYGDI